MENYHTSYNRKIKVRSNQELVKRYNKFIKEKLGIPYIYICCYTDGPMKTKAKILDHLMEVIKTI